MSREWQASTFREDVRAFVARLLPRDWTGVGALPAGEAETFVRQWRDTLAMAGLLGLSWPREYGGGGLSHAEEIVLAEELARAKVPGGAPYDPMGMQMLGPTLLEWGSEEQKARFLPRILAGEDRWCQGFSEPDSGSDLGSLSTRAVIDGESWHVDGQKVWTSSAQMADWIFVLARTSREESTHHGMSFVLVPMDQPGVEVRPITMLSGEREFNEVFFTDAVTPRESVLGPVGAGWKVAMTLLSYERSHVAATLPIQYEQEFERLLALVEQRGLGRDALVRDQIAQAYTQLSVLASLGRRVKAQVSQGGPPGRESQLIKLAWSEYHRDLAELAINLLGPEAMVVEGRQGPFLPYTADYPGAPISSGSWIGTLLHSRSDTLVGGTSEIQRNICAERVLGLPR